jgi:hypothetical protein
MSGTVWAGIFNQLMNNSNSLMISEELIMSKIHLIRE